MEPWDIKIDDNRRNNYLTTFIIFCEDENDEPIYFRNFQIADKLKVNAIPNQGKSRFNLMKTIQYCTDNGLMECVENSFKIKEWITENIWCVYDRDLDNPNIESPSDFEFTTSIDIAKKSGLKVAWSNDAFELWVLLHFEKIPTGNRLHRDYIYDRLTAIFKNIISPSEELLAITSHPLFNYRHNLKYRTNFLLFVLPLLTENRANAIANAEELEAIYPGTLAYHNCNPCTKVHHLVKELLVFQD